MGIWIKEEHPAYELGAVPQPHDKILALAVDRACLNNISRLVDSSMSRYRQQHGVYEVLCVRSIKYTMYSPCYERVGIGRLFDPEVEELFEQSVPKQIRLVR